LKPIKKQFFSVLTLVIVLSFSLLTAEISGQTSLRIFEDRGGGSNTNQSTNSNDNTYIYVVGGIIIAGILAYALFIKKDNKEESDTTASVSSGLICTDLNGLNSLNSEIQKAEEKIPVDIFLGTKNNETILNDRTYLVGLRFKF